MVETGSETVSRAPASSLGFASGRRGVALFAALAAVLAALVLYETYQISYRRGLARTEEAAGTLAQTRVLALSAELAKQRAVAVILAGDRDVIEGLAASDAVGAQRMSLKFEELRRETGGTVIYAVNTAGMAVAASNWSEPVSFVGTSYGFRSYVTEALAQGQGWEYALGSVSNRPGLYLSQRVEQEGRAVGVVIVKVEFAGIEANWQANWRDGAAATVALDAAGRVTLTSDPDWRFGPAPQFGAQMLTVERPVGAMGWRVRLAVTRAGVERAAASNTLIAGLLALPVALAGGVLAARRRRQHQRRAEEARYRADLEAEVSARTHALSEQIREREEAERSLAAMQARLVQANKLAALGQITAGVAHEVNQPLATIRLLAENGQAMLPDPKARGGVDQNLGLIVQMSDRIAAITSELRGFSRKARGGRAPVSLAEAWEASLLLSASRRVAEPIRLIAPRIDPALMVLAEKVRLEQVMVNLLQNAHEAQLDVARPEIRVTLSRGIRKEPVSAIQPDGGFGQPVARPAASGLGSEVPSSALHKPLRTVTLTVADNGPGLDPAVAQNLFTPFLTTKAEGLGLGLVISQGIVRDFGGRLWADPPVPGQGARFNLELLLAGPDA